ncbi:MAG: hypothetical protein PHV47_02790 [Candidatus Pacebacteria bacterium]|nr:hypothetical protein [Candidatus Paceibacterota bacterium]
METLFSWDTYDTINTLDHIFNWIFTFLFLVTITFIIFLLIYFIICKIKKRKFFDGIIKELCAWLAGPIIMFLIILLITRFININDNLEALIARGISSIAGGVIMIILGKKLNVLTTKHKFFLVGIIFYWLIFMVCFTPMILRAVYEKQSLDIESNIQSKDLTPGELPNWSSDDIM